VTFYTYWTLSLHHQCCHQSAAVDIAENLTYAFFTTASAIATLQQNCSRSHNATATIIQPAAIATLPVSQCSWQAKMQSQSIQRCIKPRGGPYRPPKSLAPCNLMATSHAECWCDLACLEVDVVCLCVGHKHKLCNKIVQSNFGTGHFECQW